MEQKINGNTGSNNTGDRNTGSNNTGSKNSGNYNTGYGNSGNRNSGDYNSGHDNSGWYNSGNYNSGNYNSGKFNSGYCNSGNYNSGYFNSCEYSSGFFCSKEPKAIVFNIETDMTVSEFKESIYFKAITSAPLFLAKKGEGEVIKNIYKDACSNWWNELTPRNREIIKSMPNFNTKTFKEITGITITK